jgi:hypothetical protein
MCVNFYIQYFNTCDVFIGFISFLYNVKNIYLHHDSCNIFFGPSRPNLFLFRREGQKDGESGIGMWRNECKRDLCMRMKRGGWERETNDLENGSGKGRYAEWKMEVNEGTGRGGGRNKQSSSEIES